MAKIVVLEDDASTRRLVCAVLKKSGHEVLDFDNGAEGLLTVLAELPDLVVSDVEMPKMTGFEVLSEIRHTPETADLPVILLTSLSSRADMRKGMSQGADDYITKPFEPSELLEAVQAQLARLAVRRGQGFSAEPGALIHEPVSLELTPLPTLPDDSDLSLEPMQEPAAVEPVAPAQLDSPRQSMGNAWAVSMEVQNDLALREALPTKEWRMLLRQLFMPVNKDPALRGADYLDLQESRLTLYFLDVPKEGRPGYVRAAQAVEAMVRSGAACKQWAAAQFQAMNVPVVRVVTSLHLGPIEVMRVPLDFGGERDTVVGLTAEFMQRLRDGEPRVIWRVMGTKAALAVSPKTYRLGAQMEVSVGSQEVLVHALQGMQPELSLGIAPDSAAWI